MGDAGSHSSPPTVYHGTRPFAIPWEIKHVSEQECVQPACSVFGSRYRRWTDRLPRSTLLIPSHSSHEKSI